MIVVKNNKLYNRIFTSCAVSVISIISFSGIAHADENSNSSQDTRVAESVSAPIKTSKSTSFSPIKIPKISSDTVTQPTNPEALTIKVIPKPEPKPVEKEDKGDSESIESTGKKDTVNISGTKNETLNASSEEETVELKVDDTILGFINPLKNPVKTSDFGYRVHPISGTSKLHGGVDYGASCGTSVYAAADGVVESSEWKNGNAGNAVVINHENFVDKDGETIRNIDTNYYHLSSYSVEPGDFVKRGQKIAEVGTTGGSTGCHLHWEVVNEDEKVEPTSYLTENDYDETIYGQILESASKNTSNEDE